MSVTVCLILQDDKKYVLVEPVGGSPFPLLPVGLVEIAIPQYFRGIHVMLHHESITKTGRSVCSISTEVFSLLQSRSQIFELDQQQFLPGSFSTNPPGHCTL